MNAGLQIRKGVFTHSILVFYSYMLDESICHFRGVRSILSLLFYFLRKILLANDVDPDQLPHYVASDQDLHCLPMTLLQVSKNGIIKLFLFITENIYADFVTRWSQ